MSPRLLSRITGRPGCAAWMWAINRCSAPSAPSAAKWAICGLNAQANSAVTSTMPRQKSNTASGSSANRAGNFDGSGSRPTHTSEPAASQRARSASMKFIVGISLRFLPCMRDARHAAGVGGSLQCLEPQPVRAGVVAHAAPLVFLVLAVVALEELHVRVALEGED